MYIKAIKLNQKALKLAGLLLLVVLVAAAVLLLTGPRFAGVPVEAGAVSYKGVKSNEDRVAFLRSFGWEVEEAAIEVMEVQIPEVFDEVYSTYAELQRSQGLDLTKYAGKTAQRWTYRVLNYPGATEEVLAHLLICGSRVVACDISSAELGGFMQGMEMPAAAFGGSDAVAVDPGIANSEVVGAEGEVVG